MVERNKYQMMVNSIYDYICDDDKAECKQRLDSVVDFVVRLRHSYIDNDKPKSSMDVNREILDIALKSGLRVSHVELG